MLIFGKRAASQSLIATAGEAGLKAGTHEGACSRSTLLQHAPGAKLPRLNQRFLGKKNMLRNKTFAPEFCSLISNWFDMREQVPGANLLHARVCFRSKLPGVY